MKKKQEPTKKVAIVDEPVELSSTEALIKDAIRFKTPVETMEKLLAMRRELKAELAKEAFDLAMANFQKDCPVIEKTKIVKDRQGDVRYKYAPLESIVEQVRKILGENGLSYALDVSQDEKMLTVACIVKHINGHSETSRFAVPIGNEQYMTDVQKYGARSTFAKRYAFCNAFGILTGDEDTDAVEDTTSKPVAPVQPKTPMLLTNYQKNVINSLLEDISWNEESLTKRGFKPIAEMSVDYANGVIKQLKGVKEKMGEPKDEIKEAEIVN